eukprot:1014391-Prymnesium_polylepis.1
MASLRARYPVGFAQEQRLIAAAARRYPLRDPLAGFGQHHSHRSAHEVHHVPLTKYKEEDDSFLDMIHREYSEGV